MHYIKFACLDLVKALQEEGEIWSDFSVDFIKDMPISCSPTFFLVSFMSAFSHFKLIFFEAIVIGREESSSLSLSNLSQKINLLGLSEESGFCGDVTMVTCNYSADTMHLHNYFGLFLEEYQEQSLKIRKD